MERKEFIHKITGGLALTCVACMMEACSKESTTSTGGNTGGGNTGGGNTGGNTALLTVNLNTQLLNVGDFISDNGAIVVRIATGNTVASFTAFSNACPHAGFAVTYVKSNNTFNCSLHGSNFNGDGSLKNGPATTGLGKKTVEISGTTLTVK
jgi:cytochrome b6-f complex iron-sulfur subunit